MTPLDRHEETDPTVEFDPARWRTLAACNGVKTALFFPERGQDTRQAKQVCAGCTVRDQCLQYAVDNHIRVGVYGGKSGRDRRRMTSTKPIPHGTYGGYQEHRLRDQPACDACSAARLAYRRHRPTVVLTLIDGGAP